MKTIRKKNLEEAFIFSKMYFTDPITLVDPSNLHSLIGYRESFLSLIHPTILKKNLKASLLTLEKFLVLKYNIIFITDFEDKNLFEKFDWFCMTTNKKVKNKIVLCDIAKYSLGFLTTRRPKKTIVITLFLDSLKLNYIQRECVTANLPLINFSSLKFDKDSTFIFVGANYSLFTIQNLILSLIIISLKKKEGFVSKKKYNSLLDQLKSKNIKQNKFRNSTLVDKKDLTNKKKSSISKVSKETNKKFEDKKKPSISKVSKETNKKFKDKKKSSISKVSEEKK